MNRLGRRALILVLAIALAIAAGFILEVLLSPRPDRPFGHSRAGHLLGWVGFGTILLVFIYPLRKRQAAEREWPRGWFRVHMLCGVVGPFLILVHSGAHFHALVPQLAMLAMGLVVFSGLVGQALHYSAVRSLNERRHELARQGLSEGQVEERVYRLASQEETFRMWQYLHGPLTVTFLVLALLHIVGALYFGGL